MKTYRNLYPSICEWENIHTAWRKARKGKRGREAAATFEFNLEKNLFELEQELATKTYQPGPYSSFYIHEPKRRLISAAPFRDRVVHHALCNVIEPIFERSFLTDSYANRKGKGTHKAVDAAQKYAQRFSYVLSLDMRQFFPSIDHAILRQTLARKIADRDVLWLIDTILESGVGVLHEQYEFVPFPGDDLFAQTRPRGLPIGNLTSQFWANCFMNPLDHFIKRELGCPGYIRYVDDLLLFGNDKNTLWQWKEAMVEKLVHMRLTIHPGSHPRPVTEGIPFLGFIVYPTHRRVKRRKIVHYRRKLRATMKDYRKGRVTREEVGASLGGWINHVRYADSWGLRQSLVEEVRL